MKEKAGVSWLSLCLWDFPVAVFGGGAGDADIPLVVVAGQGGRARVFACNGAARARGIHPGMALAGAWALSARLRVCRRDAGAERAALEGLAAWAGQFTPLVSLVPPAGLLLEVGGSLRLFGGLRELLARVRAGLAALGYTARCAVAPTPLGAWLLARAGFQRPVVALEALPESLAPVPLECLELPGELLEALRAIGLRRFGDCCRLPRDELARRTRLKGAGDSLMGLLDRALGKAPDPRRAYAAPPAFDRRLVLSSAVTDVEALLFAVHRLLLELTGFLTARAAGVRGLELTLFHRHGAATPVPLELVGCSRDPRHLLYLLRERCERITLTSAVEQIGLKASDIQALAPQNLDLFGAGAQPGQDWQALVERLRARLGAAAIQGLRVTADPFSRPFSPPRPLWLLEQPRPLRASGGRPSVGGELQLRSGPERIESGWWKGGGMTRDYFMARNPQGETFWIFRERKAPGAWFLHGIFA